jgi:hypothetical protein
VKEQIRVFDEADRSVAIAAEITIVLFRYQVRRRRRRRRRCCCCCCFFRSPAILAWMTAG